MTHLQADNKAQKIILKKVNAIVERDGMTAPGALFSKKAKEFRELRQTGKNFIQIYRKLNDDND